jgi:hypothetical protein
MKIIAHRGFWHDSDEQNTAAAFRRALECGFGIETDIRDYNGGVVISHDLPKAKSMSLSCFMDITREYELPCIALNVKADGLQRLVKDEIEMCGDYFFFDMSVPDSIGYANESLRFFTRYSDIELTPPLLDEADGVWLDNFTSSELNTNALDDFLQAGKEVVLVSPELHQYDHSPYWEALKVYIESNPRINGVLGLCTDYPKNAEGFFCDGR